MDPRHAERIASALEGIDHELTRIADVLEAKPLEDVAAQLGELTREVANVATSVDRIEVSP